MMYGIHEASRYQEAIEKFNDRVEKSMVALSVIRPRSENDRSSE